MMFRTLSFLLAVAVFAWPQQTVPQPSGQSDAEHTDLQNALSEGATSSVDLVRLLEAFLKKYPNSSERIRVEQTLAKAAVDNKDDARIVLYGPRVLDTSPDDLLFLDRVTRSMLALGGAENAKKALEYGRRFGEDMAKLPAVAGPGAVKREDDRDRGVARGYLYRARAEKILGDDSAAEKLAVQAFSTYPNAEAAREWGEALVRLGRKDDAIERLADAFTIPDLRALDEDRAADRRKLWELYRERHKNEKGLGDLILAAYDRTAKLMDERQARMKGLDPNTGVTDAMKFTLTALDGTKFQMGTLKGEVVILDFWATWCGPCRTQHPMYEELKKRYQDRKDIVFLAIDTDEDRSLVAPFLNEIGWSKTVYFEDGLSRLLNVTQIPTTVLIDKQGRVASRMNGFLPDRFVDQMKERINALLADSMTAVSQ